MLHCLSTVLLHPLFPSRTRPQSSARRPPDQSLHARSLDRFVRPPACSAARPAVISAPETKHDRCWEMSAFQQPPAEDYRQRLSLTPTPIAEVVASRLGRRLVSQRRGRLVRARRCLTYNGAVIAGNFP